jgi:hypothetical protein
MAQIFISYRRSDSGTVTGRIYDRLIQAFGKGNIFKDIDNIPIGPDFRGVLRQATANCRIMLVIIGPSWASTQDTDGNRRLDNANDFVRLEIEAGLQRDEVLVVPVLVSNAKVPSETDLPLSLRELAYNNAAIVRDDPDFHKDMDRLIEHLKSHIKTRSPITNIDWRWLVAAILIPLVAAFITIIPSLLDSFKESEIPIASGTQIPITQAPIADANLVENEQQFDLPTATMVILTQDPILKTPTLGIVDVDVDFKFSYPGEMTRSGDNGQFIFTDSQGNTINLYTVAIYRKVLPDWQTFTLEGDMTDVRTYCLDYSERCQEALEKFIVRVGFKLIRNRRLEEAPKIENELTRTTIALEQRNQHGVAYLIDIHNGNWTVITVLIGDDERDLPESLTNSLADIAKSIAYSDE